MEQIADSKSRKTRPREEKRGLTEVIKQQFLFKVQCRPSGQKENQKDNVSVIRVMSWA